MSTGIDFVMLSDLLRELESALDNAQQVDVHVLDRLGQLVTCTPAPELHRGVTVYSTQTSNTNQYRDDGLARVRDSVVVEHGYLIAPTAQRESRDEALVLEEQIRALLTGLVVMGNTRPRYASTTRRQHPQDATLWITAQTFTIDRDAILGG